MMFKKCRRIFVNYETTFFIVSLKMQTLFICDRLTEKKKKQGDKEKKNTTLVEMI